jgi:hypothetical protein
LEVRSDATYYLLPKKLFYWALLLPSAGVAVRFGILREQVVGASAFSVSGFLESGNLPACQPAL